MHLRRIILASLCLSLLAAVPALGLPKDCDEICTPSTPPGIVCACGWGNLTTTCGEWLVDQCGLFSATEPGLPSTLLTELGIAAAIAQPAAVEPAEDAVSETELFLTFHDTLSRLSTALTGGCWGPGVYPYCSHDLHCASPDKCGYSGGQCHNNCCYCY
ncbi:MAG: hypothetical protein MI919_05010 [Holophagales bacterium]|nr:hypothetical protein [Holophagales bacterium]